MEGDGGTPTPVSSTAGSPTLSNSEELVSALVDLLTLEKWSCAISFVKQHKGQMNKEGEVHSDSEDDVALILNVYCRKLVQERPGKTI